MDKALYKYLHTGRIVYSIKENLTKIDNQTKYDNKCRPYIVLGNDALLSSKYNIDISTLSEISNDITNVPASDLRTNGGNIANRFDATHPKFNNVGPVPGDKSPEWANEIVMKVETNDTNELENPVSGANCSVIQDVDPETEMKYPGGKLSKDDWGLLINKIKEQIRLQKYTASETEEYLKNKDTVYYIIECINEHLKENINSIPLSGTYNYDKISVTVSGNMGWETLNITLNVEDTVFTGYYRFIGRNLQLALEDGSWSIAIDTETREIFKNESTFDNDSLLYILKTVKDAVIKFMEDYILNQEVTLAELQEMV